MNTRSEKNNAATGRKKKGKKWWILTGIAVALLCLILPGLDNRLTVTRYALEAAGLSQPVRIVFVSDLHSCAYGEGMRELIDAVDRQQPDLILLGGDIFDDTLPDGNTLDFLRGIGSRYPCYYVTGNHENWVAPEDFAGKMAALAQCGVIRLSGAMAEMEIRGQRLNICGADDPCAWQRDADPGVTAWKNYRAQLREVSTLPRDGAYTILLTHRPELLELYAYYGYDLVLAGHAHGGQARIPGLVDGLFAPNQGWFPKYTGGTYEQDGTVMIVGRGLARESTRVPRFYNPPELVIVDLQPTR